MVAQLVRVSDWSSEGRQFDSAPNHQFKQRLKVNIMLDKDIKNSSNVVSRTMLGSRVVNCLKQSHNLSFSKEHVLLVLDEIWNEVIRALKKGEEVRLINVCAFRTSRTKSRITTNPQTNEKIEVPEKTVPRFKFAKVVKQEIANDK